MRRGRAAQCICQNRGEADARKRPGIVGHGSRAWDFRDLTIPVWPVICQICRPGRTVVLGDDICFGRSENESKVLERGVATANGRRCQLYKSNSIAKKKKM